MYLGLDIGTSSVKGLLLSDTFKVIGAHSSILTVSRPFSGWSEQNPLDWIRASETVIQTLRREHRGAFAALQAIGLSGQMHGAVFLDRHDHILRPCILWNDSRSYLECTELEKRAKFREVSGNAVMSGFTAPKVRWLAKNEPGIFRQTKRVLLPKDFVRLWLTGDHATDMSDASGTLWLDVEKRCWSEPLVQASGLPLDALPRLVEGSEISGRLRSDLAVAWGIPCIPVAGGGGDNAATACGHGILRPGTGFLSLGTSGVLFAACDAYLPNTQDAVHTFCHAVPGTWHHMGVVLSAADSLTWLGQITGHSAPALTALLPAEIKAPSRLLYLPYLCGERTPHDFPFPAGTITNLSLDTGLADLVQAVLEGVGFAFEDCNMALTHAGTQIKEAFAVGGGARSRTWLQILANITGIRLLVSSSGEFGAAYGAAKLGMACLEKAPLDQIIVQPQVDDVVVPQAHLVQAYRAKRKSFKDLSTSTRRSVARWNRGGT